ncbi:MAG: class I adenylate cyclase [Desulfosarcinaceae bacterium]
MTTYIEKILSRNKRRFSAYNAFRQQIFHELAPKEAETTLYLLPWLLSVNEPGCPGYIPKLKTRFRVCEIDYVKEIREKEKAFKNTFRIRRQGTLLKPPRTYAPIQGLYTIGSVGSVGQTSTSDIDIWVCVDKSDFDMPAWRQLAEKLNLIKDWLDVKLKMPVYFFITEVNAIRECRFGSLDAESSGTTQQQVLKEEFYRTCMVICGKTPVWWLCYDASQQLDYDAVLATVQNDGYWEYDLIDFGSALWLFNKSLSRPLKSIIKLNLLKCLLEADEERLLCHLLREKVMQTPKGDMFPDFSVFTVTSILEHYGDEDPSLTTFLTECYYMLCEINPYDSRHRVKNKLASEFLKKYPIERSRQTNLRKAREWHFKEQLEFGTRLFQLLLRIYREISASAAGAASESDQRDLTILSRKIAAFYHKKNYKIPVVHTVTGELNVSNLTLQLNNDVWQVFCGFDQSTPVIWSTNVVYVIAFIVWNGLFESNDIHMRPNSSSVTLQEVVNLATRMRNIFGTRGTQDIDFATYLKKEFINRIMVVVDFEASPWYSDASDYSVIHTNCWGEMFVNRMSSTREFNAFLTRLSAEGRDVEMSYYVQRNTASFEKLIERAKQRTSVRNTKLV